MPSPMLTHKKKLSILLDWDCILDNLEVVKAKSFACMTKLIVVFEVWNV